VRWFDGGTASDHVFSADGWGNETRMYVDEIETFLLTLCRVAPDRAADPEATASCRLRSAARPPATRGQSRPDYKLSAGVDCCCHQARMGSSRLPGKTIADVGGASIALACSENEVRRLEGFDKGCGRNHRSVFRPGDCRPCQREGNPVLFAE